MTTELKTWGEISKYTWDYCWAKQRSNADTKHRIQTIGSYWPRSLPLTKLSKGHTWLELQRDLYDDLRLSNGRINKIVSAASHALRFTYKLDLHSVKRPYFALLDVDESRQAWFTKEQVDKLAHLAIDLYENYELAEAIKVSAYTGMRQGEFLRLRCRDIDLTTNVIWVGGRPDTKTKSGKSRSVPISQVIKPLIIKRLETKDPNGLLFGDEWLNKDQLYKQFVKVRKVAGFDDSFVWHSLRHSFCTWLGTVAHPRAIMEAAGHQSMDTTLRYCKAVDSEVHEALAAL